MSKSLALARNFAPLLFLMLAACSSGSGSISTSPAPSPSPAPGSVPTISNFIASNAVTNATRPVTLNWTVSGATSLLLQPGAIDVTGKTSQSVTPTTTTTYILQATNASGAVTASTPVRVYDWTQTGAALDSFVSASTATNMVTGYTFLLFDDQGPLFSRSQGDQTASSVEPLASATKLPSVAAILTLVDSGRINLDTPVKNYLLLDPTFTWPADKAAITMRMLLAHTSGIPGLNDNQPSCLNDETGGTLKACAQDVANAALVAQPGAEFNYGGADFQVAGYIATLLSLKDWQTFFADTIGTPLGLTTFTYGGSTVTNPRIAGGASSNATDYMAILQMIRGNGVYNGKTVLSAVSVATIQNNQISGLPVAYEPFPASRTGYYPGYGLGLFISNACLYPGSAGPEFSDPGLFGTTPWFDNGLHYGAVLLIKNVTSTGLNMWDAARPTIITQLTGQTPAATNCP